MSKYLVLGSFGLAVGLFLYPKQQATPESVGTVCSKSGTYQIRAPTPRHLTKEEHCAKCEFYVKTYEKVLTPSSYYRPHLEVICGINPDDIVKNVRGQI